MEFPPSMIALLIKEAHSSIKRLKWFYERIEERLSGCADKTSLIFCKLQILYQDCFN
jgi:hypothetical protein